MWANLLTASTVRPRCKARRASRAEFKVENLAYAVPVYSTIAKGTIRRIDSGPAEQAPGVLAVITHQNIPRMKAPPIVDFHNIGKGFALSDLPIMQNADVHWDGEPVALVVAETLERAEHAASLVSVEYDVEHARSIVRRCKDQSFCAQGHHGRTAGNQDRRRRQGFR